MSITMRRRAVDPGETMYEQTFATDRTADFGGTVGYDATVVYADEEPDDAGYLYADIAGAISIGDDSASGVNGHIDIAVVPRDRPVIYMLLYVETGALVDITYSWRDSGGDLIGSATVDTTQTGVIEVDDLGAAPDDAAYLRINWLEKGASATAAAYLCALRVQNAVGYAVPNYARAPTGTKRKPQGRCLLAAVSEDLTVDFTDVLVNADTITCTGDDVVVSGKSITITPTEAYDTGTTDPLETYTGIERQLAAYSRGIRATDVLPFYVKAIDPDTFERNHLGNNWETNHWVEVDRTFSADFISKVQGGLWPYTATVISKPSWLEEKISGRGWLAGVAPSTAQSQASIIVDVTDALDQTIRFTETITVVAERSRTPDQSLAGGTVESPVNIYTGASLASRSTSAPYVVSLTSGHYNLGIPAGYNRSLENPIIIVDGGGGATVKDHTLHGCSGVIFEGVTFDAQDYLGDPDSLSQRSANTLIGKSDNNSRARGHLFFYDCTSKGWKSDDLSLEPDADAWTYKVRTDSGHEGEMIYRSDSGGDTDPEWTSALRPDHATVQSSYPDLYAEWGHAYYNGGFKLGAPMILEGCHVEQATMGYVLAAHSCAMVDCTAKDIRVDVMRPFTDSAGIWVKGFQTPERPHYGNRCSDEHPDMVQMLADGYDTDFGTASACAKRVLFEDCGFFAAVSPSYGPLDVQGVQVNTGWSGDGINDQRDPRLSYEDIHFKGCAITVDIRVVRATFGDFTFDRCLLAANYDAYSSMSGSNSYITSVSGAELTVTNSVIGLIGDEGEVAISQSGNIAMSTLTPTDMMPDADETAMTLLERHRISPTWAASNSGVAPAWLVSA